MAQADEGAAATAEEAAGGAGGETTVLKTVQSLGAVIGPTALITALLFYFGWAKTEAFSQYFGLDVSLFGLSTQDYMLQSIHSVYVPLGEVLVLGLLLLWAHRAVSSHLARRPDWRVWPWMTGVLAVVGAASFVTGVVENSNRSPSDAELLLTPASLMVGVGLASYAILVDRRRRHPGRPVARRPVGAPGIPGLSVILVSALVGVSLVWLVANYAEIKGRQEAEFVYDQLEFQPGVVVFSPKRLHIDTPGVKETRFPEPESAYAFRYDGLKLLYHSNGRYFLVPASWSPAGGTTVALRDSEAIRLEFVRPAG